MEFGIINYAHATMKARKPVSVGGMELSSGEVIPELESDKCYRKMKQLTSSKLNGRNRIRAINSWAVSLVRYSAGILKWRKDELKFLIRKTPKIMTINTM